MDNHWCEIMTKLWNSQLGYNLSEPHSTTPYYFIKKQQPATAWAVAEKNSDQWGGEGMAKCPPYDATERERNKNFLKLVLYQLNIFVYALLVSSYIINYNTLRNVII